MSEFRVYGKDGLFHNIVKRSTIMNGRYAVLPKGAPDLNISSLISSLELPGGIKYPGVFCLPPYSEIDDRGNGWETFIFRLLFLCRTHVTGDNQIKTPDYLTNTSGHTIEQDWSDMKNIASEFLLALQGLRVGTREFFRLGQTSATKIVRVSKMQTDGVSGVLMTFTGQIPVPCVYTDIAVDDVDIPEETHENHFH